jgi:hypothetical protein
VPSRHSFINGFFSIANLGQWARAGASLVARWGIPELLNLGSAKWDPSLISSDFFLYQVYQATVGRGVLSVGGDGASNAVVYAHCASERYKSNGSVTVFAANPSLVVVTLKVSLPSRVRGQCYTMSSRPAPSHRSCHGAVYSHIAIVYRCEAADGVDSDCASRRSGLSHTCPKWRARAAVAIGWGRLAALDGRSFLWGVGLRGGTQITTALTRLLRAAGSTGERGVQ